MYIQDGREHRGVQPLRRPEAVNVARLYMIYSRKPKAVDESLYYVYIYIYIYIYTHSRTPLYDMKAESRSNDHII